ncbi:MAG: LytTR family transcriptional regulator DNA-binding domain-containing protein, partial [Bacteroidales bacterium]|nr:LytTR family transcriptional regulator DNA-binding domain-containing protein [Bacteroidales bacterium]
RIHAGSCRPLRFLFISDICYFYSFEKGTFTKTISNRDFLLDSALENIFPMLDPKQFFKISRKHFVNIQYIKNVYAYSTSRLRVHTSLNENDELVVSREKVSSFKAWLEGN